MVKENWPNFMHGKTQDEVKVTRMNWLSKLSRFPVEKIQETAIKMSTELAGEWAPNITQIEQLASRLTLVRPEHKDFVPRLPGPKADADMVDAEVSKMKSALGQRIGTAVGIAVGGSKNSELIEHDAMRYEIEGETYLYHSIPIQAGEHCGLWLPVGKSIQWGLNELVKSYIMVHK